MVAVTRKQYITLQDTKVYPHTNLLSGLRQRMLAELYCFRLVRPSVCPSVRGHSNSVILIVFFPNFIYGVYSSTSRTSSNTGFVRHSITKVTDKMVDKMAATYIIPLSWSL